MDVTTLIVIFLAFTSVTVVTNTLLILFAYKGFSGFTMKVTEAVREFESSAEAREWLASLERAAAQAVVVTEVTKQKMADYDPVLESLQGRYGFVLAKVDARVDDLAESLSATAARVRDAVAEPVEKLEVVTGALKKAVSFIDPDATSTP